MASNQYPFSIADVYPYAESYTDQKSTSAIDWTSELGQTLLPLIQTWAKKIPGIAQDMGQTLQDQYSSLMRGALQPQAFQGTLNQLANKGILNSSISSNALSDAALRIAQGIGKQGYTSAIQGIEQQLQIPGKLAELAELARTEKSETTSRSEESDQLAPYQLMADLLTY